MRQQVEVAGLEGYASRLVAPIATPETLSEESVAGSIKDSLLRIHHLWRRENNKSRSKAPKEPPGINFPPDRQIRTNSPGSSDVCDLVTESSSAYCSSPLSSVRMAGAARSSRSQLKREIMRLYQRAAADVDSQPGQSQSTPSSAGSNGSRTGSSSPSQPRTFPVLCEDQTSSIFGDGVGNYQRYSVSPVSSRPATANGATGRQLYSPAKPLLPPCNTSF